MRRNSNKPKLHSTSSSSSAACPSNSSSAATLKMVSTRQMSSSGGPSTSAGLDDQQSNANIQQGNLCNTTGAAGMEHSIPSQPMTTVITRLAVARNYDQQNPLPQSQPVNVITRLSVARQAMPSTSKMTTKMSNLKEDMDDAASQQQVVHLFDLPRELLLKIFSYLDFKEVGQSRLVCADFNEICGSVLNSTFTKLTNQMNTRFHSVKASMPRRESVRRNHPLACECDIIETCHMRLALLQMTFGKHIERKHCFFFPGAILDEIYRILRYIKEKSPNLGRPFQVTDELFDLSTMAMEYFKDKLEPILPEIVRKDDFFEPRENNKNNYQFSLQTYDFSDDSSSNSSPPQTNMVLRKGIRKIRQGMKMYSNQLSLLRNELRNCKKKSSEQSKQTAEQQKVLAEQQKQILEYANRFEENDKKNEEMSRKFSTLLQELNKCKTELQYWRSKSPATKCGSCGQRIPMTPPEVYQVLQNQGIKPEDLESIDDEDEEYEIRNGGDEEEESGYGGESNISANSFDSGISSNSSTTEFVSPDDTTTAMLMAINSATAKKRSYNQASLDKEDDTSADLMPSLTLRSSGNGCPPSKFYSKASTSSVAAAATVAATTTTASAISNPTVLGSVGDAKTTVEVTSLNCIASNETKKARRVQKGNGGSSTTVGVFNGIVTSGSGRSSKRK